MKKLLAALITTVAMVAGPAVVFAPPAASNAGNYAGTVATSCHAGAIRFRNPRNWYAPFRLRVATGGNGPAGGKVFFTVRNQRTKSSFIITRDYDGNGWERYRFGKWMDRGLYRVNTEFYTPNGSVYRNCKANFEFRVTAKRRR